MVALATAFVALAPTLNKARFIKSGQEAGRAAGAGAGASFGKGFQGSSQGVFKSLRGTFVGAANLLVPLALAGAVKKIYDIGTAYQDNLNIFQVVTKATGAQMDAVAGKARALGADFTLPGVSAAGAAAAMTELAKAGFTVQQSMDAAKGTLQLARIAGIGEGEASMIAANAVNAFGIAAKDTTFVVDELAAAANQSSVDINDVDFAFRMASATFSGFQAPVVGSKEAITELNTAVAILGNNGIRGSDAGTSLKQMLLQLTGPTERAKVVMEELALRAGGANVSLEQQTAIIQGSKKVRDQSLKDIKAGNKGIKDQGDIAYTAAGQMRSLPEILDLVIRGTKGMTQENKNAVITQIFGADATRSIIALMKGGLPVYDRMRKAVIQQGAAADFARAKNIGLKGSLDNVRSQVENIAIEIFNQVKGPLTSAFTGLANQLATLPAKINSLGKTLRDNRDTLATIAHVLGAVTAAWVLYKLTIFATTNVLRIYKTVQEAVAFLQLASQVRSLAEAWALLDASIAANPIGIIVVAIAALAAGLVYAYKHSEAFRNIVDAVGRALRTAFVATVQYITGTMVPTFIKAYDQVKGATLFLYHNVILPVWNGIKSAISAVVGVVRSIISGLVTAFNAVKGAFAAVGDGIKAGIGAVVTAFNAVKGAVSSVISFLHPAFAVIEKIFEIFRLLVLVVIYAVIKVVKYELVAAINTFKFVWNLVFGTTKKYIEGWWNFVKGIFQLFQRYIIGPVVDRVRAFGHGVKIVFDLISNNIRNWYRAHIVPIFAAASKRWHEFAAGLAFIYNTVIKPKIDEVVAKFRSLGVGIKFVWTQVIKPVFDALVDMVKNRLVNAFRNGVRLAGKVWDGIKLGVEIPVKFVVDKIVNPFIGGLNKAASIVGVPKKYLVSPVKLGFAEGGQIPGAPSHVDNRLAVGPNGLLKVASGEFITNTKSTLANLGLVQAINRKRGRVSRDDVDPYLDGAARGGLVRGAGDGSGFFGGIWDKIVSGAKELKNIVTDPAGALRKVADSAMSKIPGGGMLKEFLTHSAGGLLTKAINWIKSKLDVFGGGPLGKGNVFGGYRGMERLIAARFPGLHVISDFRSHARTLSGRQSYHALGRAVDYPPVRALAAWIRGTFGAKTKELITPWNELNLHNGQPHRYTGAVWNQHNFAGGNAHVHWAARMGGLIGQLSGMPVKLFDRGGMWPSGTLGANLSGRTEYVDPNGYGGDHITIVNRGVIGSRDEVDAWFEDAYKRAKRRRRI